MSAPQSNARKGRDQHVPSSTPLDLDALKAAGLNSEAESARLLEAHRRAEQQIDRAWVAAYENHERGVIPPTAATAAKRLAMLGLQDDVAPQPIALVLAGVVSTLRSA